MSSGSAGGRLHGGGAHPARAGGSPGCREPPGSARRARGHAPLHRLCISGRADVVEYHADAAAPSGVRPYPVEYKRGRAKHHLADHVQLCAQAMCLEEMHGISVPEGALYYGKTHRRLVVHFDAELRAQTQQAAHRLHELVCSGLVPSAEPAPKCRTCSLEAICMPEATAARGRARAHLERLAAPLEDE